MSTKMQIATWISGGRFRKQIRRALPLYITIILLFVIVTQIDHIQRYQNKPGDYLKKLMAYQSKTHTPNTKFPKKIWQTWKVDPLDFEERESTRARSWTKMNTGYRYEVLTDGNDLDYVETHFGPEGENRPDIVETYRTLNATIIKADLLRYLVMYVEGGVYADIDVEALKPVHEWMPKNISEHDVGLMISVEIDEPTFANHTILGQKSQSFCQWTFMCKPRQPVMLRLIEHVLHWLNEVAQSQNTDIAHITLNFDEVITGTGPSAFTGAIMREMQAQTKETVSWDMFHALQEPRLVGNILVMTVEAFAAGQGHSNSGNHDNPKALIKHHYHASLWPSRHPRYSHPAFGMVEECNWNRECVEAWNHNTTHFDENDDATKERLIKEHEAATKEKQDKEDAERAQHDKEHADKLLEELGAACVSASYSPPTPTPSPTTETTAEATPTGQAAGDEAGKEAARFLEAEKEAMHPEVRMKATSPS